MPAHALNEQQQSKLYKLEVEETETLRACLLLELYIQTLSRGRSQNEATTIIANSGVVVVIELTAQEPGIYYDAMIERRIN